MVQSDGGVSALKGIRYEILVALYHVPDIMSGKITRLRYQPLTTSFGQDEMHTLGEAYLDDISWEDDRGVRHFAQVKSTHSRKDWTIAALAAAGVMGQLGLQFQQDPDAELHFISNVGAIDLGRLVNHASRCSGPSEFDASLSSRNTMNLAQLMRESRLAEDRMAFSLLRQIRITVLPEESITARLSDFEAWGTRTERPSVFFHLVKEFIERNPGRALDLDVLREIKEAPLRGMPKPLSRGDAYVSYAPAAESIASQIATGLELFHIRVACSRDLNLASEDSPGTPLYRFFIAVITEGYATHSKCIEESQVAVESKMQVRIVLADKSAIPGVLAKAPLRTKEMSIERSEIAGIVASLRREIGIGRMIVSEVQQTASRRDLASGLIALQRLSDQYDPRGIQEAYVRRESAHLLRLIGDRDAALGEIRRAATLVRNCNDAYIIQEVAITLSQLYVDEDRFEAARSALLEATLALGKVQAEDAARSAEGRFERLRAVGELTREMARTYLEEARRSAAANTRELLEIAWSQYCQSAAMLSMHEDARAYAWIYENRGDLLRFYAEVSTGMEPVPTSHIPLSESESLSALRGKRDVLLAEGKKQLEESLRMFSVQGEESQSQSQSTLEGSAWAYFHLGELAAAERDVKRSHSHYQDALSRFADGREGAGLCHLRLFETMTRDQDLSADVSATEVRDHGLRALAYCRSRAYLKEDAKRLGDELQKRGWLA